MKSVFKFFQVLFYVFMVLFLIGGAAIVIIQTFGIVTASGGTVTGVNEWLSLGYLAVRRLVRYALSC